MTCSAMTFSAALALLKLGSRVARAGWNGKGMWVMFVGSSKWSTSIGPLATRYDSAHRLPWLAMKTADHGLVPWSASQTDILAEDWQEVE